MDLFENHLSNYPTGCPKFIEKTSEQRRGLVDKVRFCRQCLNPEIIYTQDHLKTCTFSKQDPSRKSRYTCTKDSCRTHMWICLVHKQANKKKMEQFKVELSNKGQNLALVTVERPLIHHSNSQAYTQAVRKILRNNKKKKKPPEIVPVPDGEPLFLFHAAQGKQRSINIFYDSGCSHAVFRDGVPGGQLSGQLIKKGPFHIGGVGGLTTTALEEWVVVIPRTDGKRQLVLPIFGKKNERS